MRIVKLDEFIQMPPGTLFQKYGSVCCFEGMAVKISHAGIKDLVVDSLHGAVKNNGSSDLYEKLEAAEVDSSISLQLDFEYSERLNTYGEDMMFAVYEKADILELVSRLAKCL